MRRYFIEPRTKKYVKGYWILLFARKYKNQFLDTGLDSSKSASKKVAHKAGKFISNKAAGAVTKSNGDKIVTRTCWRNNYSTRKKRWNIKQIEKSIIKMQHYKIYKLLNDSSVFVIKFVTKNGSK